MKRPILAILLSFALLLSSLPFAYAFSDTEGHWAQAYLDQVVESQLCNGVSEDCFAPNDTMTRGMFVTVLGRFEGIDSEFWSREGAPEFFKQDVDDLAYYAPHIRWGVCNGIVNGVNDFLFAPNRAITREQRAKLLSYYLDAMGHSLSTEMDPSEAEAVHTTDEDPDADLSPDTDEDVSPAPDTDTDTGIDTGTDDPDTDDVPDPNAPIFADMENISSWALESVVRLYSAGILTGFPEDDGSVTFRPQATATRAQCAAVFCRIQEAMVRSEVPPVSAEDISLNKEEVTLSEGYSFRLVVTTTPADLSVLWRSSDTDIVTVDQEGLVTFVAPGHAQVSVYTRDGLYDTCDFICEGPEEDTGNDDTGDDDTGNDDTNNDDTGNDDTNNDDTGNDDTGNDDTGNDDTGNDPTPPNPNLPNASFTKAEKCMFMFGEVVSDPRNYYDPRSESEADMVKIDIQAWYLKSNGQKEPRTWTLTVHKNLAETIKAIFDDIFNGPEQFPIHQIYCYSQSGKSEHTIGSAIDINWDENYYCDPSGNALVGNFWKPGENPYSITPGGDVATAFAKYGFIWGINWNSGYKDYMHFSFFGT